MNYSSNQPNASDKIARELFVGNTPPGTSEQLLLFFVNAAMRRVGLCDPYETPVVNARVNNKFAFVELKTVDLANKALNLNGIPFLSAHLKLSRPSKYNGPMVPSATWQQLTNQTSIQNLPDPEVEKLKRELFIGNTTPEMTAQSLTHFLGTSMEQVKLTIAPGNPITACRVSGKFAFIELRSTQEAQNALNLNGIPFMGIPLRVGRPSKYNGPPDPHGNWEDIVAKHLVQELEGTASAVESRVVECLHMLSLEDLNDPDEYQDILDDTREQCGTFGTLKQVIIPKANEPGATKIFLEYETSQQASVAIQELAGRTFDGRRVEANFFDETKFANKDFA